MTVKQLCADMGSLWPLYTKSRSQILVKWIKSIPQEALLVHADKIAYNDSLSYAITKTSVPLFIGKS